MKKISLLLMIFSLVGFTCIYAQPHANPDMNQYWLRNNGNGGHGGIGGWNAHDGLGPVVNVHSTGASIGGGGHYQTHIAGWNSQDGLGPVVNNQTSHNWNNNNNSNSNWGNGGNNSRPNWGGGHTIINPNTPWNNSGWNNSGWNNSGWNNAGWSNPGWSNWGGSSWGISASPVVINNYYNPNYWWRDLRNPPPYSSMSWGGYNYYYHDGNFFNIVNGIYQVVLPVLGLILQAIPAGATRVTNYNNYYSYHGVFYYNTGNGYKVVAPPIGACLPSLPYFAKAVVVNGIKCYKYDNIYIEPMYNNADGDFCYRVVAEVY